PVSPFGQICLHPTALFGRSRTLTPQTHWIGTFPIDRENLLDPNVMLPVIVEVILVQKPFTEAETKISQAALPWVIGKAAAALVGDAILFAVDNKPMEMAISPPQNQL